MATDSVVLKRKSFFGKKQSPAGNDDLLNSLRDELGLQFARFPQQCVEDLLPPIQELIEDLFQQHIGGHQGRPQEAGNSNPSPLQSLQSSDLAKFLKRQAPALEEKNAEEAKDRKKVLRSGSTLSHMVEPLAPKSRKSIVRSGSAPLSRLHLLDPAADHRSRPAVRLNRLGQAKKEKPPTWLSENGEKGHAEPKKERRTSKEKPPFWTSEASEDERCSLLAEIDEEGCPSRVHSHGLLAPTPRAVRGGFYLDTEDEQQPGRTNEDLHPLSAGLLEGDIQDCSSAGRNERGNDDASSEEGESQSPLLKFVRGKEFDYTFCVILALNSLLLGLETDFCARHWSEDPPGVFVYLNQCFCCLFVMELLLRVAAYGPRAFFIGKGWKYNVFDSFVVSLQVADESSDFLCHYFGFRKSRNSSFFYVMRLLRYFRLLRVMRLSRALAFLVSVRVLVVSILASLRSLGWLMFLIALQTFVASIPLTQLATDYKLATTEHEVDHEVEKYYGSIDRTMLALYEMLTDGLHWDEIMRPLVEHTSPWLVVFFVVYSAFAIFAMLNVVTGVFVDSALVTAEESRRNSLLQNLKEVFLEPNSEEVPNISLEAFELKMANNPNMEYFLKAIDIVPSDARQLFMLLDADGSGEIDAEELIVGCSRLQGPAKALDLAALMYMFSKQIKIWDYHFAQIDSSLETLCYESAKGLNGSAHNM